MAFKAITIGAAALLLAAPAGAQQRGTVEFGAFGSAGFFDKALTLDRGFGAGGHLGIFLDPRWVIEFEKGEMRTSRTLGRADVNVGMLGARLVATPIKMGALSFAVGAGAGAGTETNFLHSYGVNALVGAKLALGQSVALRVDVISDWLANNSWQSFQRVQAGLSFYRQPRNRTVVRTIEVPGPAAPPYVQKPDSVSAEEQARLRRSDQAYSDLRDSLNRAPVVPVVPASSASALATMEERIHFATDKSVLTDSAKVVLDAKVAIFRANPDMRIVIVGNTDERASDIYNMALGERRSAAAKAYLVSQGIDPVRIENTSAGERSPMTSGTSTASQGMNRRAEFRLLIASGYLVPPLK